MLKHTKLTLVVGSLLFASIAEAAPFVALSDIHTDTGYASSYTGSNSVLGGVSDGGNDAFDGFGYYHSLNSGLSINRQVDLLAGLNTYRWVDTFTNTTGAALNTTATFYGNLGSDGSETIFYHDSFLNVSYENSGGYTNDPILSIVNGNNAWASSNMSANITPGEYNSVVSLSLAANQSLSIAHFTALTRPNDIWGNYDATSYVSTALATGNNLINNPYFSGLSASQVANIKNFSVSNDVPEPTSIVLLGMGLLGFSASRKKSV